MASFRETGAEMTAEEFAGVRRNSSLSREALSELLGITPYLVCAYETGKKSISDTVISRLYAALPVELLLHEPPDPEGGGMRLKELRESLGHSQSSFADALGVEQSSISVVETGVKRLNPLLARRICEATSADFCYLMYGARPGAWRRMPAAQ